MMPFKDKLEMLLTATVQHAQNAGSAEDQILFLFDILDSDLRPRFETWKLTKNISPGTKMSEFYPSLEEMIGAFNEFYYVYLDSF